MTALAPPRGPSIRGIPTCARCHKAVAKIMTTYDLLCRETTITVTCHGAVESVKIADRTLVEADTIDMSGAAFVERALPVAS